MTFWDIFCDLCRENMTTPNAVTKAIGLSNAAASKWKKGSVPNSDTIKLIADYFGKNVSYFYQSDSFSGNSITGNNNIIGNNNSPSDYDEITKEVLRIFGDAEFKDKAKMLNILYEYLESR